MAPLWRDGSDRFYPQHMPLDPARAAPGLLRAWVSGARAAEVIEMAKYAPLVRYLRRQRAQEVTLTFRDIERIVGGFLPKASTDLDWWRAEAAASAPQKRAFAEAGFTARPEIRSERVLFVRSASTSLNGSQAAV